MAKDEGIPNLGNAKLEVIFGDHQASPEIGMSETERLYLQENVVTVVGCYQSGVTSTASAVAERLQRPFLNPDSTSPKLVERGFKWFFRLTPDDKIFTYNMFKFIEDLKEKRNEKIDSVALVCENTLWGQDFAEIARETAKKSGLKIVEDIVYPAETPEVTSEVQRIKAANPDVVIHASYVSDSIIFMKTYKEQGYAPKGILADAAGFVDSAFIETLGGDADYTISRSVWSEDLLELKPVAKDVNDLYKARYGISMNENSARAFMGIIVFADAINRAGSTEPEAIRKAILETNIPAEQIIMSWDGIGFDPDTGQNVLGRAVMTQIINGEYATVWPFEEAAEELVWPFPAWDAR
jgi:branched-chain amino acid transport system substrate-binding protein